MFDIQLGRRNLSPIQRIAVFEKRRKYYERKAKEKQSEAGGDRKSSEYKKSVTPNLVEAVNNRVENETNSKLAKLAGVGKETYRMGAKILNSDNEEVKNAVLSGEMSIPAPVSLSAGLAVLPHENIHININILMNVFLQVLILQKLCCVSSMYILLQ